MSRDEFLVFGRPVIEEAEIAEVVECLRSGWPGTGPRVDRFERMLEAYTQAPHVRCLSSCTAALVLGMRAAGIGPGDEVIVPAMTFVATANAVVHVGAHPVLVDCDPRTGLVDLDAAEAAIGHWTRALLVVHLAGQPVDLDRVAALSERHGLLVVEDAAHALGAAWRGKPIGAHGHLTAFSFSVSKNITTVEGGALATGDPELAARVERLANHGLSADAWTRFSGAGARHYEVEEPGFKERMTDMQAALGIGQLGRLDAWIEARAEAWRRYDDLLEGLPLELPGAPPPQARHARHLYRVAVPERDRVADRLADAGIGSGVHYRGVHLHPYYRRLCGIGPNDLPAATRMSETTLSLPLDPALTESDQRAVADALRGALEANAAGNSGSGSAALPAAHPK
jgi:dTDP-4-amino-4,6-dideoxygalactose transaminase